MKVYKIRKKGTDLFLSGRGSGWRGWSKDTKSIFPSKRAASASLFYAKTYKPEAEIVEYELVEMGVV